MTHTPPSTRAIDALHYVAETLAVWIEAGEFSGIEDHVRADLELLPATLREIGKGIAQ